MWKNAINKALLTKELIEYQVHKLFIRHTPDASPAWFRRILG